MGSSSSDEYSKHPTSRKTRKRSFQVSVMGSAGCGKTTIISACRSVCVTADKHWGINLYFTENQLPPMFSVVLFCFAVNSWQSFKDVQEMAVTKKKDIPNTVWVLLGLKNDLVDRGMDWGIVCDFAAQHRMPYLEVSAKNRQGLEELVSHIAALILRHYDAFFSPPYNVRREQVTDLLQSVLPLPLVNIIAAYDIPLMDISWE